MPPPDRFNRGLAPPCIWTIFERELKKQMHCEYKKL